MEAAPSFKALYSEEVYSFSSPVTIVIEVPWADINDSQRQLLSKILLAVKQSLESVRVLSLQKFDLSSYQEKPSKIIAFITPPKGFGLYEVVKTGDTSVIFSDSLETLITDDSAKRKLWAALKEMF
jgi:DNA polymerase III psi subunit